MDLERGIETQRLRLLRLVAGLVVLLGFLAVGPVSRGFSEAVCGYVGSILSRAEAAGRFLVIARARLMVARTGLNWDQSRFSDACAHAVTADDTGVSLADCRARIRALRAVLTDVPRHALRLIRRIEKRMCDGAGSPRILPRPEKRVSGPCRDWRLAATRVERPPDKHATASCPACYLSPMSGREAKAYATQPLLKGPRSRP